MGTKVSRREFFRERIPRYKADPVFFFREVLQFEPDPWQIKVARDVAEHPRVTVRSGQGVGKTGLEAALVLWFLSCFPYARVVCTAPTKQQLHDVLWSEIAKWQARSPLLKVLLKWTKTYIYVVGMEKRWYAVARTATKPENMQGFHEDNMLFVVDEASGVADPIMEAIQGTLSGINNKLLMCGNPTKTSGYFYDSHNDKCARFRVHHVSSRDSPRTSKENIKALEDDYGADSNVVRVRVDGEFPNQENDVFIPLPLINSGVNNELWSMEDVLTGKYRIGYIALGVDIARFGDDETVIASNVDGVITLPMTRRGQDLMRTAGDIVRTYRKTLKQYPKYTGKIIIYIDDTGLGGGVTDRLNEVRREEKLWRMTIRPVNFAEKVPDSEAAAYYANIATYQWAIVRDYLRNKELVLPDDGNVIGQFSARKYSIASHGRLILEPKDAMKKRGIKSPDRAEAIALSCMQEKRNWSPPVEDTSLIQESYWQKG